MASSSSDDSAELEERVSSSEAQAPGMFLAVMVYRESRGEAPQVEYEDSII
jgi:hypothetical protein